MKKENRSVKLKMYFGAATACVLWLTVLYKRSSLLKKGLGELCFCLLMGAVILGYSVWNYRVLKWQGDPRWAENGQKVQSARMLRVINMFLLVFLPALEFVAFESLTTFLGTIGSIRYVAWNLFCIYLIVGILYVIFNRSGIAGLISNIALSVLGLTEYFVSKFRGQPLRMGDLLSWNTALEVSGQYKYNIKAEMLVGISIMLFLMVWCLWYSVRIRHIWKRGVAGLLLLVVSVFFLNDVFRGDFLTRNQVEVQQWRPLESYQEQGFLLSTLAQLKISRVTKPEGYSVEKAQEIAEGFADKKAQSGDAPVNLIVMMNESLADLRVIGDFETTSEVTPFLDTLRENTIRGNLYVSMFGGGTANTEYEVLTGNTVSFLSAETLPYQNFINHTTRSAVHTLTSEGYDAIAFHPSNPKNYSRSTVYPLLGFEDFYSIKDFSKKELEKDGVKVRRYLSDRSDVTRVEEYYEAKEPGEKWFMFNVTMQNHGGYEYDTSKFPATVQLTSEPGKYPDVEQYLSLLQLTDQACEELIGYFSKVEEKTAILIFGDHLPKLSDEFYEALFGKALGELSAEETQRRYVTPFILWTNYDIEEAYVERISANYLLAFVMERLGIQTSAYQKYLMELYEKVPAMNLYGYYDTQGRFYTWDQVGEVTSVLNEYRILQYNNLFDKKHQLKGFFE